MIEELDTLLNGKRICVLMTCDKPQYIERRTKHEAIYKKIQDSGFIFVYLICEPNEKSAFHLTHDPQTDRYTLRIPMEESYSGLPTKMVYCYSFFNQFTIKGILKIDDDVSHIDNSVLEYPFDSCDYTGAKFVVVSSTCVGDPAKPEDLTYIDIGPKPIKYYGGPFYWVSKRTLGTIVELGAKFPWEDVNTGYAMTRIAKCKIAMNDWFEDGLVLWAA
jgi:hypothetical protein